MADLYNLASHYWGGERISLHASHLNGDIFATFPLSFVRGNGINSWEYVITVAKMLVNQDSGQSGVIYDSADEEVDLARAPSPGHYVYSQSGTSGKDLCIHS